MNLLNNKKMYSLINAVSCCCDPVLIENCPSTPVSAWETKERRPPYRNLLQILILKWQPSLANTRFFWELNLTKRGDILKLFNFTNSCKISQPKVDKKKVECQALISYMQSFKTSMTNQQKIPNFF